MHCSNAKKMATAPVNLARKTEHWVQKHRNTAACNELTRLQRLLKFMTVTYEPL